MINIKPYLLPLLVLTGYTGWTQNSKTIKVLDATVKDAVVSGAEIYIQKNGRQSVVGTTNSNGEIQTDRNFDDDEQTMLIIKKNGYSTLVVKCPCQGYTYALSPSLKDNQAIRVVLSWGWKPADLDIHAIYGTNHVYYGKQNGPGANLDVDDRNGYGPETITVVERDADEYTFWVRDYTNKKYRTDELSRSNAKVFVYRGDELVNTYYLPGQQEGNLWKVFSIDRSNRITDYNELSYTGYFGTDYDDISAATEAEAVADVAAASAAPDYLQQGEEAYARKDYEAAVRLYMQALRQSAAPEQPHIVNNIALAALRMGKYAECIEASNKVTTFPGVNSQEKANAHYNAGMAYEKMGQYRDAAQQYQKAANTVSNNTAYLSALKRVRKQIK
jgi:hypothetical protein